MIRGLAYLFCFIFILFYLFFFSSFKDFLIYDAWLGTDTNYMRLMAIFKLCKTEFKNFSTEKMAKTVEY